MKPFVRLIVTATVLVLASCSAPPASKLKSKPTGHPLGAAYDLTRPDDESRKDFYAFYDGTGIARFMDGKNWVGLFDYNKRTALFGDTRTSTFVRGEIDPVHFPAVIDDTDATAKKAKSLGTGVVRQFPCHKWKLMMDDLACEVWTDDFDRFPVYYTTNSGTETLTWTVKNCWVDPSVLKVKGYFTLEDFIELERATDAAPDTVHWFRQFDKDNCAERVYLTSGQDATLARVSTVPSVQALDIGGHCKITNHGMSVLGNMHNLKVLRVDEAAITDAGLVKLNTLHNLKSLQLHGSKLHDSMLAKLKGLNKLERLSLAETAVTGHSFKEFCNLPALQSLDLAKTKITDASLAALSKCAALKELRLDGNYITVQGLKHLQAIKSLKVVSAMDTGLADEDLDGFTAHFKVRLRYAE